MMKEWHSRRVMGQASHESSWKQASQGDKEGKGVYKRKGRVVGKGVQKNTKRKPREEIERET